MTQNCPYLKILKPNSLQSDCQLLSPLLVPSFSLSLSRLSYSAYTPWCITSKTGQYFSFTLRMSFHHTYLIKSSYKINPVDNFSNSVLKLSIVKEDWSNFLLQAVSTSNEAWIFPGNLSPTSYEEFSHPIPKQFFQTTSSLLKSCHLSQPCFLYSGSIKLHLLPQKEKNHDSSFSFLPSSTLIFT